MKPMISLIACAFVVSASSAYAQGTQQQTTMPPSAQNSGAGLQGAPGNTNEDTSNIKGMPGNKNGPPAKKPQE